MEADADVNQEIIVAAVAVADSVEAVVLLSSGLSYYYAYAAATMVVVVATVVAVAAVVDSVAEILAYGLSSYYSAVVVMDSAKTHIKISEQIAHLFLCHIYLPSTLSASPLLSISCTVLL